MMSLDHCYSLSKRGRCLLQKSECDRILMINKGKFGSAPSLCAYVRAHYMWQTQAAVPEHRAQS